MLFTQYFSRAAASIALCALITAQLPAGAEIDTEAVQNALDTRQAAQNVLNSPPLIAQSALGSEVGELAVAGGEAINNGKKGKDELLCTDSLWGNLILDMAYQRDVTLKKIYKKFALVNIGTMAAIAGIAGGTLAQGIITLATLNPQQGNDTYLPGAIGIGMSGLTIATFAGRAVINHHLAKCMRNRQLEIKHRVEAVLARLEEDNGRSADSKKELVDLIGERAANEWLQLWRSSNAIATLKVPAVSSLKPSAIIAGDTLR